MLHYQSNSLRLAVLAQDRLSSFMHKRDKSEMFAHGRAEAPERSGVIYALQLSETICIRLSIGTGSLRVVHARLPQL